MYLQNNDIYLLKPYSLEKAKEQTVSIYLWKHTFTRKELTDVANHIAPNLLNNDIYELNDKRFKEKVSVRLLLAKLLDVSHDVVAYHDTGKPYLECFPYEISMSHTADVYAVSMACFRHGMDVEKWGNKALKVKRMFVNAAEDEGLMTMLPHKTLQEKATLVWSAKEAVYKWKDKAGLSLKNDILLMQSEWDDSLQVNVGAQHEKAFVNYKSYADCILTCCGARPFAIK